MKRRTDYQTVALTLLLTAASTLPLAAQSTATPAPAPTAATEEEKEEVVVLSPFEVTTEDNEGYSAATTLAGNRLNTELRDIGNAVSVITSQFLKDTGAVNNETLLQYTTGTEVGNLQGNFAGVGDSASLDESGRFTNPNQNTRVRGLTAADNTRDYFLTDIPWDGYNIDRVDLQRGPNSILFGQGSPAGLINSGTQSAGFKNSADLEFRLDDQGSFRASLNVNRELIDDELAFRVALLKDDQKFQQKPAFQDNKRFFVAGRWEPGFLKKGSARTIIKFNYEDGSVRSNRPRTLPPNDLITPWFYTGTYSGRYDRAGNIIVPAGSPAQSVTKGQTRVFNNLNKATYNPHLAQNDNLYRSNTPHGLTRPAINGGPYTGYINPYFNPWIGNFGQSFGGPIAYHANDGASPPTYFLSEIRETYGINSNGGIDNGLGFDFNRQIGVNTYNGFARAAQLPFAEFGVYKDKSLTDESVFNFYDNLLDGPNKQEWSNFDVFNISLAQTFFNEKMGFEVTYNAENYDNGQLSLLSGTRQGIFIDMNNVYSDGTPAGTGTPPNNIPEGDGTPNPNLGRPFITDSGQFGNNSYESERENTRATVFITHDFEEGGEKKFLTRLLGRHTLTGLWAKDEQTRDSRSWQRYSVLDPAFRNFLSSSANFTDNAFAPNHVIYLGPSLLSAASASGANIPRPTGVFSSTSGTMRAFDSHWANRPGVSPSAQWINDAYLSATAEYGAGTTMADRRIGFQADNPANYVGWVNMPVNITDSEAQPGNRDLLATSASLRRPGNTAKAVVWQGHLWDNAIVGTYGWRRDTATGDSLSLNTTSPSSHAHGFLNLSPSNYSFSNPAASHSELTEDSKSWSVVAHISQFFGDSWPVRVSAFYSHSTNFQPEALRVDVYGEQIGLPSGDTTDQGVLLETKDGKYSLKINKYETAANLANSNALGGAWFLGAGQAWSGNWVNRFQYDLASTDNNNMTMPYQANNRPAGAPNPAGFSATIRPGNPEFDATNSLYNYGTDVGETLAQAQARENAAVAAWRTWQAAVDPRFYTAWGVDLNAPFSTANPKVINSSVPNGFALTEDSVSKGYEIEFSAQPTRNWRLTLNAAKTSATRKNIGGANLAEFIEGYNTALNSTKAGDLRIWWGGSGNETALYQWNTNIYSEWTQRALQEGTNVPELREWRLNAISNYDFTEGRLKGFNVGGGIRWQDDVVVGYQPVLGTTPGSVSFDIDNPYMGPTETAIDLWIGYKMRLADKVDWRIQFNVRNLGDGDGLIPVTVQPDGSPAAYRIAPSQQLTLTNTFSF